MKSSEFLRKINVDVIGDLSELDKRFIDKEELFYLLKILKTMEKIENLPMKNK